MLLPLTEGTTLSPDRESVATPAPRSSTRGVRAAVPPSWVWRGHGRAAPSVSRRRRPSRAGIVRPLSAWLFVALLIVLPSAGPASASTFRETLLARLTFGSGPDQFAASECEDCDTDACSAFAFLGADGSVFVFDRPGNSLQQFPGLLKGRHEPIRSFSGPPLLPTEGVPYDGCVGSDGTIFLLTDRGTSKDRFVIHARAPRDTSWQTAAPFDDGNIGWMSQHGVRIQVAQAAAIGVDRGDVVTIWDSGRIDGPAIVVASEGGLLPAANRRLLDPDSRRVASAVKAARARLMVPIGRVIGVDDTGRLFQVNRPRRGRPELRCYATNGRLVASTQRPWRPIRRIMIGQGELFVTPDGSVVEFRFVDDALEVTRWEIAEAP